MFLAAAFLCCACPMTARASLARTRVAGEVVVRCDELDDLAG
jgi:hypothetical protein